MGGKVSKSGLFESQWDISQDDGDVAFPPRRKKEDTAKKGDFDDVIIHPEGINIKEKTKIRHRKDEKCSICLCEYEKGEKICKLNCKHKFHGECITEWASAQSNGGDRFQTNHARCPECRVFISTDDKKYSDLNERMSVIKGNWVHMCQLLLNNDNLKKSEKNNLKNLKKVQEQKFKKKCKALQKLNEMEEKCKFIEDYLFYMCFQCGELYFGGMKNCGLEHGEQREGNKKDRVCGKCCQIGDNPKECSKHGSTFIAFKCRYCCNVANWFCFGTHHFCEQCHTDYPNNKVKKCPGSPNCKVKHNNGKEQCLGCVLCTAVSK